MPASIERAQSRVNCFITLEPDAALAQAVKADREIAKGAWRGTLHGVPFAHKDMFYRAGKVSTCGAKIKRDYVPGITALVQERFASAGALYRSEAKPRWRIVYAVGHVPQFPFQSGRF